MAVLHMLSIMGYRVLAVRDLEGENNGGVKVDSDGCPMLIQTPCTVGQLSHAHPDALHSGTAVPCSSRRPAQWDSCPTLIQTPCTGGQLSHAHPDALHRGTAVPRSSRRPAQGDSCPTLIQTPCTGGQLSHAHPDALHRGTAVPRSTRRPAQGDSCPTLIQTPCTVRQLSHAHPDALHSETAVPRSSRHPAQGDSCPTLIQTPCTVRQLSHAHPDALHSETAVPRSSRHPAQGDSCPTLIQTPCTVRQLSHAHPDALHSETAVPRSSRHPAQGDSCPTLIQTPCTGGQLSHAHPDTLRVLGLTKEDSLAEDKDVHSREGECFRRASLGPVCGSACRQRQLTGRQGPLPDGRAVWFSLADSKEFWGWNMEERVKRKRGRKRKTGKRGRERTSRSTKTFASLGKPACPPEVHVATASAEEQKPEAEAWEAYGQDRPGPTPLLMSLVKQIACFPSVSRNAAVQVHHSELKQSLMLKRRLHFLGEFHDCVTILYLHLYTSLISGYGLLRIVHPVPNCFGYFISAVLQRKEQIESGREDSGTRERSGHEYM
ncbi:hypothetical protein P4O66_017392 [Electrophorus voltai]|uniref:Uncharacterized protein n=1 Tax=Electrophorus voltai TaxID=2609070 RepID=A0AAD8YT91_9TELE|nr:hypothetical protein P4O66_017392 [Electrophorus voltai]